MRTAQAPLLAILLALLSTTVLAETIYFSDGTGRIGEYDTSTMTASLLADLNMQGLAISQCVGLAFDPIRDQVIICDRNSNPRRVIGVDVATGMGTVLFNPTQQFEGAAVLNDTLYGIDEGSDRVFAYDLSTFAPVPLSGTTLPSHCHGIGVDMTASELFAVSVTGSGVYPVDAMGTPTASIVGSTSISQDIDAWNGDFLIAWQSGPSVELLNGTTGVQTTVVDTATLTGLGIGSFFTGVALRQFPTPVLVRTVDTMPIEVAPGQTGIAVTMDVENITSAAAQINAADLLFLDSMGTDVTSEYTITPSPSNPMMVPGGGTDTFGFTVDVDLGATVDIITVDGEITATNLSTMSMGTDRGADTPDSWEVIGALPMVRLVDALPSVVSLGGVGYRVDVDVENAGLLEMTVGSLALSFTGSVDRTSEYTVTPDPANPTVIPTGATVTFGLLVDVDPMASVETITIDAGIDGTTTATSAMVSDPNSDVTDTWDVVMCAATLCGDCNGDGMLSILDALTGAQHAAALITLTGIDFTNCNVIGTVEPNPGADVDILDALTLAQAAAGLPVTLVCC